MLDWWDCKGIRLVKWPALINTEVFRVVHHGQAGNDNPLCCCEWHVGIRQFCSAGEEGAAWMLALTTIGVASGGAANAYGFGIFNTT